MSMDYRLTEMLVCPVCKGPLQLRRDEASRPSELICPVDQLAYPIRDGIPVMLEGEARHLEAGSPPA
jgi:uncharacterized protein YbaR (Trm112 family)